MRKLFYLLIIILLVGCTSDEIEYCEKPSELKSGVIEKALGDFYLMVNPQSRGSSSDFQLKVKSINKLERSSSVSRAGSFDERYIVAFDISENEGFAVLSMDEANTDVIFFTDNGNVNDISNIDALGSIVGNHIVMPGITIPDSLVKDDNPPQSGLAFLTEDIKLFYREPIKDHVKPGWPHNIFNEACNCGIDGEKGHKLNYSVSIALKQALEYYRPRKDPYPYWYGDGTVSPFPNVSAKDALIASDMSRINEALFMNKNNPCDMLDKFGIDYFKENIDYKIYEMAGTAKVRFEWEDLHDQHDISQCWGIHNIENLIERCETFHSAILLLEDIPNFYKSSYVKTVGWNIDGFLELKNGAKYYYCDWCTGTDKSNGWIHNRALMELDHDIVYLLPADGRTSGDD